MARIGIVGAGLIGRSWAMVFARAGHEVALWDGDAQARDAALGFIRERLDDLLKHGLIGDPGGTLERIRPVDTLDEAVRDAAYVQESLHERLETKREMFARMDEIAPKTAMLASSTSTIPASAFTETLTGRARCLVAHPVNPPYLVPVVELSGAPWTTPDTLARARALHEQAGMQPILVKKEIQGFILNRLQAALLNEAVKLVRDGYVSQADLDITLKHGLGLRWAFMGPFETIDLNAPGGIEDYCRRYAPLFHEMAEQQAADTRPWDDALVRALVSERRETQPADELAARQEWRDRRLMALLAHKHAMEQLEQLGKE